MAHNACATWDTLAPENTTFKFTWCDEDPDRNDDHVSLVCLLSQILDIQATKDVREMRAMKDMRHMRDMWEVHGAKA